MKPTFSIILPVFRSHVALLIAQLEAIRGQRWPLFECLVIDDGSPGDELHETLLQWAATDARFVVSRSPSNEGISRATNRGIIAARNEFVVFCDHDDLLHVDALAELAKEITTHPTTDVVYSDETLVDETGAEVAPYLKPDWSPERLLGHPYVNHLTCMRRSLAADHLLRPELEPSQDYDLLLRVTPHARRVGHVARSLYSWRAITGSTALSAQEKPGVSTAVRRAVTEALARRGDDAQVVPVANDPNCQWIVRRPPTGTRVAELDIDGLAPAAINQAVSNADADVVVFVPASTRSALHEHWYLPLAGQATRPQAGWCGPRLVSNDGRLVSVGRTHGPRPCDLFAGVDAANAGPWGAFTVAREVASVAVMGAAISKAAFLAGGGLPIHLPLQVAMVAHAARLRVAGRASLWTPAVTIELPAGTTGWAADAAEQAAYDAESARFPELRDDPYCLAGTFNHRDHRRAPLPHRVWARLRRHRSS